jgi:hypothetical protein
MRHFDRCASSLVAHVKGHHRKRRVPISSAHHRKTPGMPSIGARPGTTTRRVRTRSSSVRREGKVHENRIGVTHRVPFSEVGAPPGTPDMPSRCVRRDEGLSSFLVRSTRTNFYKLDSAKLVLYGATAQPPRPGHTLSERPLHSTSHVP